MTEPGRPVRFARRRSSAPLIAVGMSFLLASVPASAQLTTNVGLKGGLNRSNFYGTDIGLAEPRQGHIFGAFVEIDFGGFFLLQPEAYYSKRGAREAVVFNEDFGEITDWVWNYNYLDFTALFKLRAKPGRSLPSLSLFAGPVISFLVGAKATGVKGTEFVCCPQRRVPGVSPYTSTLNFSTNGNDFGGTVGADVEFDVGSTKLSFDVRYTRMMKEFDQAPYADIYSRRHNAFSFQVGVSLTPGAWRGARSRRRAAVVPEREPPRNTVVIMERITREDIAARRENFSLYDLIRLERPQWIDTGNETVRGTLFLDGQLWTGSAEVLRNRRGADVEEVRRMEGAPGVYRGHGVVIEIISRREP